MKPINEEIFSHVTLEKTSFKILLGGKDISLSDKDESNQTTLQLASVAQIRQSKGHRISRYNDLVTCIAELGFFNQHLNLLYRGQSKDYLDKRYNRTKIYPSIFRPERDNGRVTKDLLETRFEGLSDIRNALRKGRSQISVHKGLSGYNEYYIALIQHYEIHSTPLIDLTQSLRVAATFALRNSKKGYVYVIGLPHPQGSISHFIDQDIVLVKLQNVCPPSALRPHYQEGYLAGKMPITQSKQGGDNLARRLVGKYLIDNTDNKFWNAGFSAIPEKALFPINDSFKNDLNSIIKSVNKK
jgi:hypothetical protein